MNDPPTTDPPTAVPAPTDPNIPQDRYLIVYWCIEDQRWAMAGDWEDEAEAEHWRDVWRTELGPDRVRMLHTART